MRILVTGGCGFIGSNFVRHYLAAHSGDQVVNLDLLTYAGNLANLAGVEEDAPQRYRFVKGDIRDHRLMAELVSACQAVVHFAAESHVDRSIEDAGEFVGTNVLGTQTLLAAVGEAWGKDSDRRFLQVGTDEVYGALALDDPRRFAEDWPLNPKSPYSASKAGADLLALAYHHTHGLPVLVTRCSNNYGPYQFPEKLIPLMIQNALAGRELPVYGDGLYVRDWLHVEDHCRALDLVLRGGRPGQVYNIGGDSERSNMEVVSGILERVGRRTGRATVELTALIRHVKDRPGHDRRYAIDAGKLRAELGFAPSVAFEAGLTATVDWYLAHQDWCSQVTSGAYRDYYERMYGCR